MKIEVFDKKEQKQLYIADVWFGLDVLNVNNYIDLCKNPDIKNIEDFTLFLQRRAEFKDSYEMDDIILEKLELSNRKNEFGRMSVACVLYAMLCNFEKDTDNIAVYPLQTELVSMIAYDVSYSNIYLWKCRNQIQYKL